MAMWGRLTLTDDWNTGEQGHHPLQSPPHSSELPAVYGLAGDKPFVVGRGVGAALRLNKLVAWTSSTHFSLRHAGGATYLRDTSSNGTWLNGKRLQRDEDVVVADGDSIQMAALEGAKGNETEHRQVLFEFGGARAEAHRAGASPAKRARAASDAGCDTEPGLKQQRVRSPAGAASPSVEAELRARLARAEAQLAERRAPAPAPPDDGGRSAAEGAVLPAELRRVEEAAARDLAELREALERARAGEAAHEARNGELLLERAQLVSEGRAQAEALAAAEARREQATAEADAARAAAAEAEGRLAAEQAARAQLVSRHGALCAGLRALSDEYPAPRHER